MAIATCALHVLAAHFAGIHAKHFGNGHTGFKHRLAVCLDQHHAVCAHGRDGRRSAYRGMHVEWSVVSGLYRFDSSFAADAWLFLGGDDIGWLGIAQPIKNAFVGR